MNSFSLALGETDSVEIERTIILDPSSTQTLYELGLNEVDKNHNLFLIPPSVNNRNWSTDGVKTGGEVKNGSMHEVEQKIGLASSISTSIPGTLSFNSISTAITDNSSISSPSTYHCSNKSCTGIEERQGWGCLILHYFCLTVVLIIIIILKIFEKVLTFLSSLHKLTSHLCKTSCKVKP